MTDRDERLWILHSAWRILEAKMMLLSGIEKRSACVLSSRGKLDNFAPNGDLAFFLSDNSLRRSISSSLYRLVFGLCLNMTKINTIIRLKALKCG